MYLNKKRKKRESKKNMRQQKNIRKKVRIVVVYCDDTRQRISFAYSEKNHIAYKTLHTHIHVCTGNIFSI